MDRFDLYELCVQSPRHVVALLRAIHGGDPTMLREDFCGAAAVSREWVKREGCTATGVDIDPEVLGRAGGTPRLHLVCADVLAETDALGRSARADVIFVGNFSIGEIHDRSALVRYFRRSHDRLGPGGVFVCDTYGGESAFRLGGVTRRHAATDGAIVHYTWEQRRADPATGLVDNALHFRVERGGEVVQEITDAFVYRWRLWSVPELRDALAEAGFAGTSVHAALPGEEPTVGLPASFIVCVAGRRV